MTRTPEALALVDTLPLEQSDATDTEDEGTNLLQSRQLPPSAFQQGTVTQLAYFEFLEMRFSLLSSAIGHELFADSYSSHL